MTTPLTGAERKMLGLDGIDADVETVVAVEFIIAARVADAERERDDALARLERYRVLYRERFNSGLSNAEWHAQHCAAVPELKRLRERIEALADEFAERERSYRASRHDSYADGQRDAWDLAETRTRALLDEEDGQ